MTPEPGTRRVLFLTGGSRGIGAGVVTAAAASGFDVAFTYRERRDAADAVIAEATAIAPASRVRAYQLDVRRSADVDTRAGLAFSTSDDDWQDVLDTNLSGAFYVARQFLPAFLANGFGRFIFMSSIAAQGMSGDVAYSASKAGMLGLSSALAKEYGRKGITSNALLLSLFETEMTLKELSAQNRDFYAKHCPIGRAGQVSEAAAAVLFLASDGASFVNGQALGVTGGLDWLH